MKRYISHKLRVEYLEIPKAACTSIKAALLAADDITPTHRDLDCEPHWYLTAPTFLAARFTFVRHPVTRFISVYRDKIQKGYLAKYAHMPQKDATPLQTLSWIAEHLQHTYMPDKHFQLQSRLRRNRQNPANDDIIHRYEMLPQAWAELQAAFNLPDLPHLNRSEGLVELTRAELNLLYKIYKDDFNVFGYELQPNT